MGGGRPKERNANLLIVIGTLAIVAGILVLVFERIALLSQLLLLAVGMVAIGVTKVLAAARAAHVALYIRIVGFVIGGLFIALAAVALLNPILGLALVVLMLASGLVVYGAERIGIGVDSTLPKGERLFSVGFGVAGIGFALAILLIPGLGIVVVYVVLTIMLFASGISFILSGIAQRRSGVVQPLEVPWSAVVAPPKEGPGRRAPEQRLHCFVVASREEVIESLGRLVRKAKPKVQQGGLEADRKANLNEDDLFRMLRSYAGRHGDLNPRDGEGWDEVRGTFREFKKRSTFPKFQWVRPVGSLTSKARIARVGYALRQTPLDLRSTRRHGLAPIGIGAIGGALTGVAAILRERPGKVPKELMQRIEAEFGLLQGGLRAYGAYILHIVGAPADVDSDDLGDLFVDNVPLLWDFGASHTEVGALDPADHLLSATTNFLLGPAILFQHFFSEGRPVAFASRGDLIQVAWSGGRRVVHRSEALDVEKGFKRGEVTVPTPLLRAVEQDAVPAPDRVEVREFDSKTPSAGPSGGDAIPAAVGISSHDLRQAGITRLDWNLVVMMMEGDFLATVRSTGESQASAET